MSSNNALRNMTNAANVPHDPKGAQTTQDSNNQIMSSPQTMQSPSNHIVVTTGSCPEYGHEILEHYLQRERTLARDSNYLGNQPEVTERMRCILLDWMVDVHIKFKLHPETFFLAVDICDRYLSGNTVTRAKLQLVGVVATLLAAKHEEIWPPEIKDCIYIAANTYSRDEILEAEREVSNFLEFKLAVPTCYPILSYLLDVLEAPAKFRFTAVMYLEAAVIDYNNLKYLPSTNAFSAVILAQLTCHPEQQKGSQTLWPKLLEQLTRTEYSAIVPCASDMLNCGNNMLGPNSKYQATRRKFSSSKYLEVAAQVLPTEVPEF